jgi:hypothetical protein
MELIAESDTYTPVLSESGKYEDCIPRFGSNVSGYYCPCGARKDKVYSSSSVMSTHIKTKTHQKWIESLNLNRANHFVENQKLKETNASQCIIIARYEKKDALKDATIAYLTQQLTVKQVVFVDNLLD